MPAWIIALIIATNSANDGNNRQCSYTFEHSTVVVSEGMLSGHTLGYSEHDCIGDLPVVERQTVPYFNVETHLIAN